MVIVAWMEIVHHMLRHNIFAPNEASIGVDIEEDDCSNEIIDCEFEQ